METLLLDAEKVDKIVGDVATCMATVEVIGKSIIAVKERLLLVQSYRKRPKKKLLRSTLCKWELTKSKRIGTSVCQYF